MTIPVHLVSVAKRKSWASGRQTKWEGDLAYCLLGIFGISMPLLYGEGMRAFIRLQEEIMKETNDLTLFAWQAETKKPAQIYYRGALAYSPEEFANAGTIGSIVNFKTNPEFSMTNKGLRIQASLVRNADSAIFIPSSLATVRVAEGSSQVRVDLYDEGCERCAISLEIHS